MIKRFISISLIFLASGTWLQLDCMNDQEQGATLHLNDGIRHARAEAQKRILEKEKIAYLLLSNLNYCQAAAEHAKIVYVNLVQDAFYRRYEHLLMPKSVVEDASRMMALAKGECQQIYERQLQISL
jgi:hypothetical protein